MSECLACKYSGSDEAAYVAYGCPPCSCKPAQADKVSEPREWWIDVEWNHILSDRLDSPRPSSEKVIHVIEKSAYNKLQAENVERSTEAIASIARMGGLLQNAEAENERLNGLLKDREEDWRRIQDAEREVERLKAENERDQKEYHDCTLGWAMEVERLKSDLDEQCRINGMGQERELKLITKLTLAKEALEQITDVVSTATSSALQKRIAHETLEKLK